MRNSPAPLTRCNIEAIAGSGCLMTRRSRCFGRSFFMVIPTSFSPYAVRRNIKRRDTPIKLEL
jgi:hypothetical protein